MQNLVADLSICQEAFKKGIKIESKFWWFEERKTPYDSVYNDPEYYWELKEVGNKNIKTEYNTACPAPLTDEILQVLPVEVRNGVDIYYLMIEKTEDGFTACYGQRDNDGCIAYYIMFEDKKLSNALLSLACKLKDENII
jgi:hypothetical protein